MAGYLSVKTKRKDIEDVYDDFSDFCLSSPARKIRRLDAELPPIIEDEEPGIPLDLDPPLSQGQVSPLSEPEPSVSTNEERALVLYKPLSSSPWHPSSSSNVLITFDEDLIPRFRNEAFWSGHSDIWITAKDQSESKEKGNDCLAVVPWVSHQLPSVAGVDAPAAIELSQSMDAEDAEGGAMEIEEDVSMKSLEEEQTGKISGAGEVLQPWQQQHCMTPQMPPNTAATPITWSW